MFSKKLVVLSFFVMLPMSCPGWAADALPETQILTDRAHYWDKLGRADMAIPIWQALLQLEPNNAEALAAVNKAGNSQEKSAEPGHQENHDATHEPAAISAESAAMPVTEPARTPEPAAPTAPAPIPSPVEDRTSLAAPTMPLQPVVIPAPVDNSTAVRQVEDWPDLYQETVSENTLPDKTAPAVPLQTDTPDARPDVDGSHNLAPLPDSANRVPLKSAKAATGILQVEEVAPVQPSNSASAPSERRIDQDEKFSGFFERQMNAAPPSSPATPAPGGQLTIEHNPAALTERAAYWESHGRRDLADKIRKQLEQMYPKQAKTVNTGQIIMSTDSRSQAQNNALNDAKLPAPDANETAKYWAAHGRNDLADNMRTPSAIPAAAERHDINVPIEMPIATLPVVNDVQPATSAQAVAHPSAQELNERAQYWETHGRSDLAVQIRQKLQLMETDQLTGAAARTGRGTGQHTEGIGESAARTALEDSLLKNPNSLKTRLDLAKIYLAAGEIAKARMQIDSVLTDSPDLPEAIFASARLYAAQHRWPETLYALEKVSPVSRTEEMAQLQKTAWAHMQIDRADALVRQGKNQEAELLLRRVATELAISDNQTVPPEPPALWKNEMPVPRKAKH